jgi:hypothetical protein
VTRERSHPLLIGNGQTTARRNGANIHPLHLHGMYQRNHRATHFLQVAVVHTGADVHVQPLQGEPAGAHPRERLNQIRMPDAMLAVFATRIGLVGVSVAKARIDAQPHCVPRTRCTQLIQHIHRAAIHRNGQFHNPRQGGTVQQIGSKHDFGMAIHHAGLETSRKCTFDLA